MTATPNGCRWCGIDQRGHAIQTGADGSHTWTPPTQPQIKDRMLARRAAKEAKSDGFDYSQHVPIEVPVGPWECIDRACEEYDSPDGDDNGIPYCSHVTVLILCAACSGASESHGIKNEVPWPCDETPVSEGPW